MPADQITQALSFLFGRSFGKYINLRALPIKRDEGHVVEEFFPVPDFVPVIRRVLELRASHDVYVGAAARDTRQGGDAAVSEVWTLWVDCDSADASEALKDFPSPPSMVVSSGTPGNCHAYWGLSAPIDPDRAENLNHRIALYFGGDEKCRNRGRILRVPGMLNHKYDPATPVETVNFSGEMHDVENLEELLPELPIQGGKRVAKPSAAASLCVRNVLSKLEGVKAGKAGQWTALCPAHDDHSPSLSVGEGDDGCCLLNCFKGCSTEKIVSKIGLTMSDLMADEGGSDKPMLADKVIDCVERAEVELFTSPDGDTWLSMIRDGRRITTSIESRATQLWLQQIFFETYGKPISSASLLSVTDLLSARARFENGVQEVPVRVAGHLRGPIYVDLGTPDYRSVVLTSEGPRVEEISPIYFRRSGSSGALPEPDFSGSVEELRDFANLRDESDWLRLVGFLLMCFHPAGPYPVLTISGEQGSAKTSLSNRILSLVDPHRAGLLSGASRVDDLALTASENWLVVLDNVSSISQKMSDTLCRISTGGGLRRRKLYADRDETALEFKRPVLINGIGSVVKRPDLLDRSLPVNLLTITSAQRRTEADLNAAWQEAYPRVLGGLFTAICSALKDLDSISLSGHPRMADVARWGEAAGGHLGWGPGLFTSALDSGQAEQLENSMDDEPEIRGLIELVNKIGELRLPATELLARIHEHLKVSPTTTPGLITRGSDLSRKLSEYAPALRRHGIECQHGREGGGNRDRYILVKKV